MSRGAVERLEALEDGDEAVAFLQALASRAVAAFLDAEHPEVASSAQVCRSHMLAFVGHAIERAARCSAGSRAWSPARTG